MKNIIKTFTASAVILLSMVGTPAFANTTINGGTYDQGYLGYSTIGVVNISDSPNSTNFTSSDSADAGETVAFSIYYHNSGSEAAQNLRVKITPGSTSDGTSHTFTGTVWADNSNVDSGTATVTLTSSQSLSFDPNYVSVCRDHGKDDCSQMTGSAITSSSGLNLGTVQPDSTCSSSEGSFCHQGTVVVHYKISNSDDDNDDDNNGSAPTVTTDNASDVDEESAQLNGNVDANDDNVSDCWFEWGDNDNISDLDHVKDASCDVNENDSEDFDASISNLDSDTEYFYRACAQNQFGEDCGSIESFNTDDDGNNNDFSVTTNSPSNIDADSAELRGEVDAGDADVTDCWFEWSEGDDDLNHTLDVSCSIDSDDSEDIAKTLSGLDDNTKYFYRACAQDDDNDEDCGSTLSFFTSGSTQANVGAATLFASGITQSSAQLNGLATSSGTSSSLTGWFQWGSTTSLSNQTPAQSLGSTTSTNYFTTVTGLSSGTYYYYRAVVQSTNGQVAYGQIQTFRTLSLSVAPAPVVIVSGTGSGSSLVQLDIKNLFGSVCVGSTIEYSVHFKNIGGRTLSDAILTVALPQDTVFIDSTRGEYSVSDHTVVVRLDTLDIGEEDTFAIRATIKSSVVDRDQMVAAATLAFTHPVSKAQESAIAYDLSTSNRFCGNSLGAFAFFDFFPHTLAGWLLLILIILAIYYIARRLYMTRRVMTSTTTTTMSNNVPPTLPR